MNLFKTQLTILQLEEYKPLRFLRWILKHPFASKVLVKKSLVVTPKIKNIIIISVLLILFPPFLVTLIIAPFINLTIATIILKPYEIYNRYKTINDTHQKILSLKNLKVIGITGSFGKTSTKEILYQILKTKYKVLRTPESFNTVFGVAKVVDLELDDSYDYFICEMAAYKIGEIKELCYMVPPEYGILTGITTQHFERFGSLANTIKAKFELVDEIKDKEKIIFNTSDINITNELKIRKIKITENKILAKNIKFNKYGSSFNGITTSLFGFANIKNIILASNIALKLGMSEKEIMEAIKNLKPFENRNVLIQSGKAAIVNNTYSSNIQSFVELIETAKTIKGKKALVTPGIVELGSLELEVHKDLGKKLNNIFDKVVLVGKNGRTNSLAKGLETKYEFINDNRKEYFDKIEELKKNYSWIFLENDVTENY